MKNPLMVIIVILIILCSLLFWLSNNLENKDREISSIEINKTADNKTWIISDKDTITKFIKALNNRKYTNSKIDIRTHDYSIKILYTHKSREEYSLWIDKDVNIRGLLMSDNKTWYINQESKSILKEILK